MGVFFQNLYAVGKALLRLVNLLRGWTVTSSATVDTATKQSGAIFQNCSEELWCI